MGGMAEEAGFAATAAMPGDPPRWVAWTGADATNPRRRQRRHGVWRSVIGGVSFEFQPTWTKPRFLLSDDDVDDDDDDDDKPYL